MTWGRSGRRVCLDLVLGGGGADWSEDPQKKSDQRRMLIW